MNNYKLYYLFILIFCFQNFGLSQDIETEQPEIDLEKYSYIEDFKFNSMDDFLGYQFNCDRVEYPGGDLRKINPKEYKIVINKDKITYIHEGKVDKMFIKRVENRDNGFIIHTIHTIKPIKEGELTIERNSKNEVFSLSLKLDKNDNKIFFFLPDAGKERLLLQNEFYTSGMKIPEADSLWGKEIIPFFEEIRPQYWNEKLTPKDSVSISFKRKITVQVNPSKKRKSEEQFEELKAMSPEQLVSVDKKVLKKYGFKLTSSKVVTYEDNRGIQNYIIDKQEMLEDSEAKISEEKYLINLYKKKNAIIQVFLTGRKELSSIRINGKLFTIKK